MRRPAPGEALGVVWRLAGCTTLIVLSFAMTAPVLAVSLQQRGYSTAQVGAFAMLPFLTIGLLIPVMPRLLGRWGVLRAYRAGVALNIAGGLAYALNDALLTWSLAALLAGAGAAALWNATEALLAREAPPAQRGRVMGLYQTALGAALALGPFAPGVLGWSTGALLWLAVGLLLACCALAFTIPLHSVHEPAPHGQAGIWQAMRAVPGLAFIAFAGGVFEAGLGSVSAAYASASGLPLAVAASVAGAIGMGSFLCQYPAGWAADHFRVRAVFSSAAGLLLAASAAFALADRLPPLMWAAGAIWGGVGGALYTLTMIQVAHTFDGRATAGGTAAMITGYTVGGTLGPLASGAALQAAGAPGLAAGLGGLALLTLVMARRF
jgi:MFS family permease